jgi:hypothetical protein
MSDLPPLDDILVLIEKYAEAEGSSSVAVAAQVLGQFLSEAKDSDVALDDANHQLASVSLYLEKMDDVDRDEDEAVMPAENRELYRSPNGDRWLLIREAVSDRALVRHEPNVPSGGQVSVIGVGEFLSRGHGPEQQALLRLIGSLIDAEDSACHTAG